ncbi:hypothetical protein C2S52_014721 [Perilla frutescens var. hirtella]|nr:hypothetical protein C2S52_014721 [Perilla frutescens var. hirtella]
MSRNAFSRLCYLMEHIGGLVHSRYVSVEEKVAMFLSILAHHKKNRIVKYDFTRSGQIVSKYIHMVLKALLRLNSLFLVKPAPISNESTHSRWKWFKGCLGALDGTHIRVKVRAIDKPRYRSRKGEIVVNVLGVCDRDMKFVYVLPGWEGSAADARVLRDAINRIHGLKVPKGMTWTFIMESSSKANKKSDKTRRCWSQREEEVLIACLKQIVVSGWKADNGFKVGYLNVLEKSMTKVFPGTDLRASPHINSKIHMIDASDDVWAAVMKIDKNARLLRFKSCPYYRDWCEIFGKDRATGEHAEDVMDAVNELLNTTEKKENEVIIDVNILPDDSEDETKTTSTQQTVECGVDKNGGGKKRKATDGNEGLYELLGNFCRSTKARLGDIARRIGYEQGVSAARKEVFEAMGKIGGLTLQEKLVASKMLVKNTEDLELFSSLPEDARVEFVRMMLAGRL